MSLEQVVPEIPPVRVVFMAAGPVNPTSSATLNNWAGGASDVNAVAASSSTAYFTGPPNAMTPWTPGGSHPFGWGAGVGQGASAAGAARIRLGSSTSPASPSAYFDNLMNPQWPFSWDRDWYWSLHQPMTVQPLIRGEGTMRAGMGMGWYVAVNADLRDAIAFEWRDDAADTWRAVVYRGDDGNRAGPAGRIYDVDLGISTDTVRTLDLRWGVWDGSPQVRWLIGGTVVDTLSLPLTDWTGSLTNNSSRNWRPSWGLYQESFSAPQEGIVYGGLGAPWVLEWVLP